MLNNIEQTPKKILSNKKQHVLLSLEQKEMLENLRLTNKEPLSDVFSRILEEKEELIKIVEEKFKKTVIRQHNQEIEKYLNRIIQLNLSIEKKAEDLIDLEIQKYLESLKEIQDIMILLADTKRDLEETQKDNIELTEKYNKIEKSLEDEINKNKDFTTLNMDLEKEKNSYIAKINEYSSEINRLSEQNMDLKTELNNKNNEVTKLINNNSNEVSKLQNEINNFKIKVEAKYTKINELNKVIDDLKIDKNDFKNSLMEVNKTIKDKDDAILELNKTQSDLINKNNKLEEDLRESNSYIIIIQEEIKSLKNQANK